MGCGISRYGFANNVEACTFHPFRRKIVEISRDDIGGGTNSTKLLLKNNGAEDDADSNSNDKTSSSPLNNKVNPEMVDSSDASAGKDKDQEVEIISKNNEAWAAAESGGEKDKQESNEDDDDDDERRVSNFDGWIGSPSFREYCVDNDDSEDHDNSSKNGNSTEGEKEETKTKREKTSASPKPNEASARQVPPNKAVKKGKRGRKFRKVFSMGRPTSMRNFMHGATCYNPNASASGNKPAGKPIEKTD